MEEFWEPFELREGRTLHWRIGPLRLWIRRTPVEICMSHEEDAGEPPGVVCAVEEDAPEEVNWCRWAVRDMAEPLRLKPLMPDRPVVVRPEAELSFRENSEGVFYARIPFWIAVMPADETVQKPFCVFPTRSLSNTWFGPDTTKGELCYAMQSSARRSLEGAEPMPYRAVCPIMIKNVSHDPCQFERLCIRTEHLSIYHYEGRLWTSRPEMTFRGENRAYHTSYNESWFGETELAELISEKRVPLEENFIQRSFGSLKALRSGLLAGMK